MDRELAYKRMAGMAEAVEGIAGNSDIVLLLSIAKEGNVYIGPHMTMCGDFAELAALFYSLALADIHMYHKLAWAVSEAGTKWISEQSKKN